MADANLGFFLASDKALANLQSLKKRFSKKYLGSGVATSPSTGPPRFAASAVSAPSAVPDENVIGVGIGEKITDLGPTGVHALTFLVKVKYPKDQLSAKNLLPASVDGVPTDVVEVGVLRPFSRKKKPTPKPPSSGTTTAINPRTRIRPAAPGCSVGFRDPTNQFVMAGTFGALVSDAAGALYILSNNHVLADEGRLAPGAPIFQPGLLDGGSLTKDQVAALTRFIALDPANMNSVDCAIAKVLDNSLVTAAILQIGRPLGTADAAFDMNVHKFGRTTGYTVGRIASIDTDVTIQYEAGPITFQSQITIASTSTSVTAQPFSKAGDSGSLIVERVTGRAVGLLFAGSDQRTIANHITDVLQALQVDLA